MINLARKYLERIENYPISLPALMAWVYFVCVARSFLEAFTNKKVQFTEILSALVYNPVYYLVHFAVIALIFYLFTRTEPVKIVKTIFLFSFFIFVGPLVDHFWPLHPLQTYVNVQSWDMVLKAYLTLGLNDFYLQGTSFGVKVEGVLALIGVASYLSLKRVNVFLAVFGSIFVYGVIGLFGLMPTIFGGFYAVLGLSYEENNLEFVILQYLILGLAALVIFYFQDREKFRAYAKTVNWFRGGIALIFFALGLVSYFSLRMDPAEFYAVWPLNILKLFSGTLCVFLTWQVARLINDLFDQAYDNDGQNRNALKFLSLPEIKLTLIVYLYFVTVLSLCLNYYFFLALALCLALSYFYSSDSLHFKRHFFLASLSMASAASLIFLSGFFVYFTKSDSLDFIPLKVLYPIFLILFLAVSFKDVKDEVGDARQSVKTIYTVFGHRNGLRLIRAMILICVLIPAWIFSLWQLLIPGLAAYALIYLATRGFERIDRKAVIFIITLLYLAAVVITVSYSKPRIVAGNFDLARDSGWHPEAKQEIWFFSAWVKDESGNPYFISQSYSFPVGSFFSLISPKEGRYFKEFYPDDGKLAATKNNLNIFQYIDGYGDADKLYQSGAGQYKYHAMYEKGMIDYDLSGEKAITLTESGTLPLLNKTFLNYYALPDLKVAGQIILEDEKKVKVEGQAILEHLWGDVKADYRLWSVFNVSLDDGAKLIVNVFNYGEKNLIYAVLIDGQEIKRSNNLEIKALKYFDSPQSGLRWLSEIRITDKDLGLDLNLKALPDTQEVLGQNLWEGLMLVSGQYRGQPASGWSNYRQVGSVSIPAPSEKQ